MLLTKTRRKEKCSLIINFLKGIFTIIPLLEISANTGHNSSSNNNFLRLIVTEYPVSLAVKRDINQNVVFMEGVSNEMLQWLSQYSRFSYTVLPIYVPAIGNTTTEVGGLYYVNKGQCDLIIGSLVMTPDRFLYLDFLHPWMEEPVVLVIPTPVPLNNFGSIWKPFQSPVWISIAVSTLVMVFVLSFVSNPRGAPKVDGKVLKSRLKVTKNGIDDSWMYVFGLFLSQGGYLRSNHLRTRLAAGAWCLATFVLVQAYGSTLISYVTTPSSAPLVDSPVDLISKTHIHVIVQKNRGIEFFLMNSEDSFFKTFGDRIRSYTSSRCTILSDCMEQVAEGGNVLIHGYGAVLEAMNDDWKLTGRCRFSLAKKIFYSSSYAWGLAKSNSMTESFRRGILNMKENGLVKKWQDRFQIQPHHCLDRIKQRNMKPNSPPRLALKDFIDVFVILCIGYCLSLVVFLWEKCTAFNLST